jgi:hypothetical protein
MSTPTPPKVKKFPAAKQRRLDALLERNAEGSLTAKETAILQSLVAEAERLMVDNGQRLAEFTRTKSPRPPVNAVPVTVWVNPQVVQ